MSDSCLHSGIYQITHIESGKFYIGSSVDIKKRWAIHKCHLFKGTHDNKKLQRAWNKYGENSFRFSVVELVGKDDLIGREQYWIDSLLALEKGYNLCPVAGRVTGIKRSKETKKLLSEKAKKRGISSKCRDAMVLKLKGKKLSAEHIEKVRASLKGRKVSEDTRMKIRVSLTGKKRDRAVVEKHRQMITGRKQSAEERAARSIAMRGHLVTELGRANMSVAQKGRKVSDETKEKIRIANLGKKQSQETIERRKATMLARSNEEKELWRMRLGDASRGRKMPPGSIERAWETRRKNEMTEVSN